jgi:hypothetical protein
MLFATKEKKRERERSILKNTYLLIIENKFLYRTNNNINYIFHAFIHNLFITFNSLLLLLYSF